MVLYQREAHAGQMRFSDIEQPVTAEERQHLAQRACDDLKVASLIVIDDMENTVRRAYGELPNSTYIIDRGGRIVHKEAWADPTGWPEILRPLLEGRSR